MLFSYAKGMISECVNLRAVLMRALKETFRSVAIEGGVGAIEQVAYPLTKAAVRKVTPWGDGHPVLLKQGLLMNKEHMEVLGRLLHDKGYEPYYMGPGRNTGASDVDLRETEEKLSYIARRHPGRKITLVTESLGALNATLAAYDRPDLVRDLIMFGGPLDFMAPGAVARPFRKGYELLNPGQDLNDAVKAGKILKGPPGVPRTSIYSRLDQVVNWRASVLDPSLPKTQNIEIPGSHINIVHNPFLHIAILDRLAEKPETWKPFDARKYSHLFFPAQDVQGQQAVVADRAKRQR